MRLEGPIWQSKFDLCIGSCQAPIRCIHYTIIRYCYVIFSLSRIVQPWYTNVENIQFRSPFMDDGLRCYNDYFNSNDVEAIPGKCYGKYISYNKNHN